MRDSDDDISTLCSTAMQGVLERTVTGAPKRKKEAFTTTWSGVIVVIPRIDGTVSPPFSLGVR